MRDTLDNARSIAEYIDSMAPVVQAPTTDKGTVKITFNIATLDNTGANLEDTERYDAIVYLLGFLSDRFGGASSYEGFGAWRSDTGEVIREANTFVYTYADTSDVVPEVLEGIARIIARRLRQDAVLLAIEPVLSVSFVTQRPADNPDTEDLVCVADCSRCDNATAAVCDSFGTHYAS